MTMRDEFAKAAMQALMNDVTMQQVPILVAQKAYEMADAMMEVRAETTRERVERTLD